MSIIFLGYLVALESQLATPMSHQHPPSTPFQRLAGENIFFLQNGQELFIIVKKIVEGIFYEIYILALQKVSKITLIQMNY